MQILVDKHIHNLFFTKRRYHCKVISRSNNAIYISLNNCRIITLFRCLTPQSYSKLVNVNPNPVTAVFPDKFPEFFIKNDEFYVSDGKFKPVGYRHACTLQYKIRKTKNIKSIKFEKINKEYLEQISSYLKTAPLGIPKIGSKLGTHPNFPGKLGCVPNFDALCEIAGAGPGLTPSTDDFICGVISVLKILQNPPHPTLSPEGRGLDLRWKIPFMKICRHILKRTTKISWYYIVLAMMGYVADWQYDVLSNVGAPHPSTGSGQVVVPLQKISYGHTSGNDWLYGAHFILKLHT